MESGKEVRGTTRSRSGPVRIRPRRRDVNATGHGRLVQRVCHSHRSWTEFRGPDKGQTCNQVAQPAPDATGGYGLWPTSTIDVNGQPTAYSYDALGRQSAVALPGDSLTTTPTQTYAYSVSCSGTSAQAPCAEIDRTQRLTPTTTITYRSFYDGMGHLVETRSPAPANKDIVQYYLYDASQRLVFQSIPYFVTGYSTGSAYSIPDDTVVGTSYTHVVNSQTVSAYDGLGRNISATDALTHTSTTGYSVVCNAAGTGDSACYEQTAAVDLLGHKSSSLSDAMGRVNFEQSFTGNSTYALYATTKYTYDYQSNLIQILHPDGITKTTFTFNAAGRKTGVSDPDRGNECYAYDLDGNLTQSTDARSWNSTCSVGSVFIGYDWLDRPVWRNITNTSSGAYATYSYDSTASGNNGVGRLTGETFSGAGMSGSYALSYDSRGRSSSKTLVVGTTSYLVSAMTYNDAGTLLSQTYPDGEVVKNVLGSEAGWLAKVTSTAGSTTSTLLSAAQYQFTGGAYGDMTSAGLDGATPVYSFSAVYDSLGRNTDLKIQKVAGSVTMFDQSRVFDAVSNVTSAATSLSTGTDNQAFCYDEQNRLTWASSASGTPPCGGQANSAGSLPTYSQSFGYDNMGRLASGPAGAYTYGNSSHVHAATAIGTTYTAAYDPAGNMTCRAPSSSATCSGTQTGAQSTYNNEGQLSNWQNQPSSPTSTAAFLYDNEGNRVAQQVTSGGSTTTTVYVGNLEEDATAGGSTTKTTYYYANGWRFAMAVGGVFSYLASDGLGSANATLAASGNATASLLYAPYGSPRYSSGTMPTDRGFTGQVADVSSGLDYYRARYYDPIAGQFASADTVTPGGGYDTWALSRYAYVEGNPVLRTDPTGHNCSEFNAQGDPNSCWHGSQQQVNASRQGAASTPRSNPPWWASNPSSPRTTRPRTDIPSQAQIFCARSRRSLRSAQVWLD